MVAVYNIDCLAVLTEAWWRNRMRTGWASDEPLTRNRNREREDPHPGGSEQCAWPTMWLVRPNNPSSLLLSFLLHLSLPCGWPWLERTVKLAFIIYSHLHVSVFTAWQGKIQREQVSTADLRAYDTRLLMLMSTRTLLRLTSDIIARCLPFCIAYHNIGHLP